MAQEEGNRAGIKRSLEMWLDEENGLVGGGMPGGEPLGKDFDLLSFIVGGADNSHIHLQNDTFTFPLPYHFYSLFFFSLLAYLSFFYFLHALSFFLVFLILVLFFPLPFLFDPPPPIDTMSLPTDPPPIRPPSEPPPNPPSVPVSAYFQQRAVHLVMMRQLYRHYMAIHKEWHQYITNESLKLMNDLQGGGNTNTSSISYIRIIFIASQAHIFISYSPSFFLCDIEHCCIWH